ncbi:MAG: ABC transporter ATP-binding protein [Clostridium butyricum]|nr:ABC transporter ATP-binding protein [Clostridium butyricum]
MSNSVGFKKNGKNGFIKDFKIIIKGLKLYNRIDKVLVPALLVDSILEALKPYILILLSGLLLDSLYEGKDFYTMITYAIIGISIRLVFELLGCYFGKEVWTKLRNLYYYQSALLSDKMMNIDYEYIEDEETQNLVRKQMEYSQAFGGVYYTMFNALRIVVKDAFAIIASVFVVIPLFLKTGQSSTSLEKFINSHFFSVGLVILIGVGMCISIRATKKTQDTSVKLQENMMSMDRKFFYYFNNFLDGYEKGKDVRIFNMKNIISKENDNLLNNSKDYGKSMEKLKWHFELINQPISTLTGGLVYLFVGLRSIVGAITIGNVVSYAGCIMQFINAFAEFLTNLSAMRFNNLYMEEMIYLLNLNTAEHNGTVKIKEEDKKKFVFEFRHVSFKYPGTKDYVIKDLNMTFDINGRMAVVGRNGSGKSTFIKLLCKLYKPTKGEILLNGVNINDYDYDEYLKQFSVVFQDSKIYSFSVGNNIAAAEEVDEERVKKSLVMAGLSKLLEKLPQGINTYVYKNFDRDGVEISGGEAQRMEIARAIYQDRPFIIMDEPTAALDPIAEYEVYSGFNKMIGNKTAIYISHRLSSCRFCDDIAVFNDGNVVQRGSHEELVKAEDGLYAKMWNAQAQYYADNQNEVAIDSKKN